MLSIQKAGFDVKLWSFDKFDLPTGIQSGDAGEIVPKDFLNKYVQKHYSSDKYPADKAVLALYSDVFRTKVIARHGGWWFDSDVFCLKPVSWFNETALEKQIVVGIEIYPGYANTAVFAIPDQQVALKLEKTIDDLLKSKKTFYWGELGPQLVTTFMKNEGLFNQALPWTSFYAANFRYEGLWSDDPVQVALGKVTCRTSAAIHWYNNTMYKLADGGLGILPGSYMGELFATLPQEELAKWPVSTKK